MFFALSPFWHFAWKPFYGFGVCVFVGCSPHETKVQIVCCVTLTRFYSISFHAFCDCAERPRVGERQNQNSVHRKYCSCLSLSAPLIEWTTNVWVGFFFGCYVPFPACKYTSVELYLRSACHIYPHGIWNTARVCVTRAACWNYFVADFQKISFGVHARNLHPTLILCLLIKHLNALQSRSSAENGIT